MWNAVRIDGSGVVQEVVECVVDPIIGSVFSSMEAKSICATSYSQGTETIIEEGILTVTGAPVTFKAAARTGFVAANVTGTAILEITDVGTVQVINNSPTWAESPASLVVQPGTYTIKLTAQVDVSPPSSNGSGCATYSHNGKESLLGI